MPAYLSLCIETFDRNAGQDFSVRLVTPSQVDALLGGEVHAAYEHLSLVHRSDYLRCELLDRYGGLYCDVDTICWTGALSELLEDLRSCSCVMYSRPLLCEAGMNVGLFRRRSLLTRSWRRALHARLDRRLPELVEFRAVNAELTEDALDWNELLRDLLVPIGDALAELCPQLIRFSVRAHHWASARHMQGFDPLQVDLAVGRYLPPPEDAHVVVLTNNQYSAAVKEASRESFLASECELSRLVAHALRSGDA